MLVCLTAGASVSLLSGAAGGEDGTQDDSSLPTWSRKLHSTEHRVHFLSLHTLSNMKAPHSLHSEMFWRSVHWIFLQEFVLWVQGFKLLSEHDLDLLFRMSNVPCENHECLSIICAGRELCSVGLQRRQTQLEDGFDTVEEETVDHADGAVEGQDAEEEGEEPREGDGGEGGEVWNLLGQFWQPLPDQLLKHWLVHLSACRGR